MRGDPYLINHLFYDEPPLSAMSKFMVLTRVEP